MALYLVTYALNNPNRDYSGLFEAIKNNSSAWWHYLPHVWIVQTGASADQFAKLLYPFMVQNDFMLVKRLAREHQGWLPREAWDWIEEKPH